MKKHRGALSIMMLTLLLSVIAVLSLMVFRTVIHSQHIEQSRINNTVREWHLRGSAECVTAKVQQRPFSKEFHECVDGEIQLEVSNEFIRQVSIREQYSELAFNLVLPQPSLDGVIKSTMDLIFLNDLTISPDPGRKADEDLWQCSAVVYSHHLYAPTLSSTHLSLSPYSSLWGVPDHEARCHSDFYSVAASPLNTKHDFKKVAGLDPFFGLWNINASDWFSLVSNPYIGHVPVSFEHPLDRVFLYHNPTELPLPEFNMSCAADIEHQIVTGRRIIWVYGGCELDNDDIERINHSIASVFEQGGIILMIQDGVLAINANISINALIMSLITRTDLDFSAQWAFVSNLAEILSDIEHQPYTEVKDSLSLTSLAYYQQGLFYPAGGLTLIGLGQHALIKTGYFAFRNDVMTEALKLIRPVQRQRGSWYEK